MPSVDTTVRCETLQHESKKVRSYRQLTRDLTQKWNGVVKERESSATTCSKQTAMSRIHMFTLLIGVLACITVRVPLEGLYIESNCRIHSVISHHHHHHHQDEGSHADKLKNFGFPSAVLVNVMWSASFLDSSDITCPHQNNT
jgi:hypothetical protein